MTTHRHTQVFQQLRQAALAHDGAGLRDAELLTHFVARRDGGALEALIRRHGSMVWSVCRRVLSHEQDAEDAFQASFLVLVRKAASIRPREQVGNWLYGVAYRTALKARTTDARRRAKERRAAEMPHPQAEVDAGWSELLPLLDQELNRLPDKYRTAIVLCELEGRQRKEAARQLGIPEGTLSSRLATGRRMLAKRLGRPGLALSAGALATSAAVPPTLLASTVKAVSVVAAGQAAVAGVVSVRVAALAEGVVKAMFLSKLLAGAVLLTVVALLAAGAGTAVYCAPAGGADPKPTQLPVAAVAHKEKTEDKKEVKDANADVKKEESEWGQPVHGVQIRLRMVNPAAGGRDFTVDVRNKGENGVSQHRAIEFCEVEWDGEDYPFGGVKELGEKLYLYPGKQIDNWVKGSLNANWIKWVTVKNNDPTGSDGTRLKPLEIKLGKHTLRVLVAFEGGITPKSQPVEIEIGKESAWGEAVDGVQARIRVQETVWWPNNASMFHLDLRNQGKQKPHAMRNPYACEIEADGAWYHYSGPVEIKAEDKVLEPGKQIDDWVEITPDELWMKEAAKPSAGPKDHLSLKPGKHTLRIAVTLAGDKWIRPISGPIEIEVSKKSPADKPPDAVTAPTKEAGPPANANETPARRAVDIQKKLNETIKSFELSVDTTLDKALDELLGSRSIPWTVNDAAFGPDNKDIVKKTPVEKIDMIKGVTVSTVLNRLLAKIPNDSGKSRPTYLIRPDGVEITTLDVSVTQLYPNRSISFLLTADNRPPPVYAVFDKVPLSEAFAELGRTTGGNVIVAGYAAKEAETKVTAELNGVPLDAAVTVLADMAELKCVRVGNIYYVTTPERARQLETDEQKHQLKEEKQAADQPMAPDKAEPKK